MPGQRLWRRSGVCSEPLARYDVDAGNGHRDCVYHPRRMRRLQNRSYYSELRWKCALADQGESATYYAVLRGSVAL
jgi:hypothetical protein